MLAAITVGGSLFGIMGMLMGVPLVATFYKLAFYKLEKKETELAGIPNQLPEAPPDKPKATKKHKK